MKKLNILQPSIQEEFSFQSLSDFASPIYLDNNATTKIDDDASMEMFKMLEKNYGNPSGFHEAGRIAKAAVALARERVARFIGCHTDEIIFTSCATESINTVINSVLVTQKACNNFFSCLTEHGATLNSLKALDEGRYNVYYLDVDTYGNFNLAQLEKFLSITPLGNSLVSLMAANNETGTIHNNIGEAISLAHKYGALFHVDAVQVAGKLPLNTYICEGTDFLSISGHKFHAPKGIGVLYIRRGTPFSQLILGGAQELGRRAGTENVPAIAAIGVVADKMPLLTDTTKKLHDEFIKKLLEKIPTCIINGGGVPGTINVGFKFVHREALITKLSLCGVYASAGSACSKGIEPSHVLSAMHVPDEYIHGSVRFSMSKYTTEEEIDLAIEIIVRCYENIRRMSVGIV